MLDKFADRYDFPVLDNENMPMVACKVSLYADKSEWILFFEILSCTANAENNVYAFGSHIKEPGLQISLDAYVTLTMDDEDDYLQDLLQYEKRSDLSIYVNHHKLSVDLSEGIIENINKPEGNPSDLMLVRVIYEQNPNHFWLAKKELFDSVERKEVPLVFESTEWEHPDIVNGEKPSDSEFFKALAKRLDDEDIEITTGRVNTDWLNWLAEYKLVESDEEPKMIKTEIQETGFKEVYRITDYTALYKIDFLGPYGCIAKAYAEFGPDMKNSFILNISEDIEEDLNLISQKYQKEDGIITTDSMDEEFLEVLAMEADQGYLSIVFLFVKGEYDKSNEIVKVPKGGACFMWELDGEGAYLAVNEESH
ncbi:DUF7003 family protein [Listeria booriae]